MLRRIITTCSVITALGIVTAIPALAQEEVTPPVNCYPLSGIVCQIGPFNVDIDGSLFPAQP